MSCGGGCSAHRPAATVDEPSQRRRLRPPADARHRVLGPMALLAIWPVSVSVFQSYLPYALRDDTARSVHPPSP
jgi:hypothetical protein